MRDHPYGHYRYENAASLVLGALLLAVGVGMLWSAIHKIQHPETIAQVKIIALWVALSGTGIERTVVPLHAGSCQALSDQKHAGG